MERILVVEDDVFIQNNIVKLLRKNGFEAEGAGTALDAEKKLGWDAAMYIIDVILPDGSGFELCKKIRENQDVPIIFLTACDDEESVTKGLNLGGDDYVTKPFRSAELIARIQANLRRIRKVYAAGTGEIMMQGTLLVDLINYRVVKDGEEVKLTPMEFKLLQIMISNPGIVLKRELILQKMWDNSGNFVEDNTLTVTMRRLKNKLGTFGENDQSYIETIRGFGYRWNEI